MSETAPIIQVHNLSRFFGDVQAVSGVTFKVMPGQVVGFIGANGAGKTTTMRMMVTLEQPDSGWCTIAGYDVTRQPMEARRNIGWMPDAFSSHDHTTVLDYLDFHARALGFSGAERRNRVREVLEFTDLTPIVGRQMGQLSKGMGQRLCLGRTLLHDPPVLVLDEPAAGLDPKARVEFKHLVRLLAEEGKTLFISSHILSELEEMCDTMLFIHEGRIVHHGTAEALKGEADGSCVVVIEAPGYPASLPDWIRMHIEAELLESTGAEVRIRIPSGTNEHLAAILRRFISEGIPVTQFRREQVRLEDAFVKLLSHPVAHTQPPKLPVQEVARV